MIKKILHIVVWVMIFSWFIIVMGFVTDKSNEVLCKRILIELSDSADVSFINQENIRNLVAESNIAIQGYPVLQINTRKLETIIERNPYIKNAEVYATVSGDLYIEVEQRKPIIRVMPGGKKGYYIDNEGFFLPLSSNYSPRVLLLTGNVPVSKSTRDKGIANKDSIEDGSKYMFDVLEFARFVEADPFWSAQIVQLYRNQDGEYEIIPRVGAHQILLGQMDNYKEKLRNLKLLYDQGLQKYGWNNYSKINLKYSNQVICTKR